MPPEEFMPRLFAFDERYAQLESLAHYLVGLTLVLKGIDLAEQFSRHSVTVLFLFCAGAFIILSAVFHHRIEKNEPHFTALFHVAEGVFLILIGLVLMEKDSRQPYLFFFAGAAYLALGAFELFRDAAKKKDLLRFFLTVPASVFLAAAGIALAVNLFGSNNTRVYFAAGVLAVIGMFVILVRKKAK
jgi:surface polysaccharide O-acyltransferase-like enzyme